MYSHINTLPDKNNNILFKRLSELKKKRAIYCNTAYILTKKTLQELLIVVSKEHYNNYKLRLGHSITLSFSVNSLVLCLVFIFFFYFADVWLRKQNIPGTDVDFNCT